MSADALVAKVSALAVPVQLANDDAAGATFPSRMDKCIAAHDDRLT